MKEVLSPTQLKHLKEHQYSASGQSLIEPWFQVFWRWLIEQVPLTWAPNSITLLGLVINILTTLLLVFCSPDGATEVNILAKIYFRFISWTFLGEFSGVMKVNQRTAVNFFTDDCLGFVILFLCKCGIEYIKM